MKVSYFLNKMPVEANDLIGESGNLIIHIEYKNNIKNGNVHVPFLAVTSLILDGDRFSNVKVYGGKVIDDGNRKIVTGFAAPGMTESIGLAGMFNLNFGNSALELIFFHILWAWLQAFSITTTRKTTS